MWKDLASILKNKLANNNLRKIPILDFDQNNIDVITKDVSPLQKTC